MKEESEDLWERIELLEQIVSSNDELFRGYISKFMKPHLEMSNLDQGHLILRIDAMCEELIDNRKTIRNLKREIKNLER